MTTWNRAGVYDSGGAGAGGLRIGGFLVLVSEYRFDLGAPSLYFFLLGWSNGLEVHRQVHGHAEQGFVSRRDCRGYRLAEGESQSQIHFTGIGQWAIPALGKLLLLRGII